LTGSLLLTAMILHSELIFGSQISVTDTPTLTDTILWLGGQSTLGLANTDVIVGGVVSTTFTRELHELGLFEESFALQVNGVVPNGKVDPEAGVQPKFCTPGQLSDTVSLNVTTAPLGLVHSATGEGHKMVGGCWSTTVTVAVQELDNVSGSVTVRVTGVVPRGYGPPGDWLSVTGSPSASDEPLSTEADAAEQRLGSVGTVVFLHSAVGGVPGRHGLFIVVPYCAAFPKSFVVVPGISFPKLKRHAGPVPA